jgi:hypothetical protein
MDRWPFIVHPTTSEEIRKYVKDVDWQFVRLSMKGVSTRRKLVILDEWRDQRIASEGGLTRARQVQIDNYINALRRGGQLDRDNKVQK